MIGSIISIILALIIIGVIWWAIQEVMKIVPMPEPIRTIVRVLLIVLIAMIAIWVIIKLLAIAGIHVALF